MKPQIPSSNIQRNTKLQTSKKQYAWCSVWRLPVSALAYVWYKFGALTDQASDPMLTTVERNLI